jgi:hypothetical protein
MAEGLRRHGVEAELFRSLGAVKEADFVVTWGWRKGKTYRASGRQVLVMERGYLGDRFAWTSLGWNGLNGRATWADDSDKSSERFDKNFGHLVKPWRTDGKGYALIIGQVPGDMSLDGIDMAGWYLTAAKTLEVRGYEVKFRPHPIAEQRGLVGATLAKYRLGGSLEEALAGAAVVASMNSNTGVDAALAGVPTIVCDQGAMAWSVAAHGLDAEIVTPDRADWCRRLAWKQFTLDEISSGEAWEHIKGPLLASHEPLVESSTVKAAKRATNCLVIGGAACVWDDVTAALELGEFDGVVACNDVGADWSGKLDAWVSLHPEKFPVWQRKREANGFDRAALHVGHKADPNVDRVVDYRWPGMKGSGSSGLYAAKVAMGLGFDRIVLCGVPMEAEQAHYFDRKTWNAVQGFKPAWLTARPHIANAVRSMSGWSAQFVGKPSENWLTGGSQ